MSTPTEGRQWLTAVKGEGADRVTSTVAVKFPATFKKGEFHSLALIECRYGRGGFPEWEVHDTISEISIFIAKLGGHLYREDYFEKTSAIQVYERWGEGTFTAAFYIRNARTFEQDVAAFQATWSRRVRFIISKRADPTWTFWSARKDEIERSTTFKPGFNKFGWSA